jgi:NAD(P)-dependent dehydrogenase (short-subunit alcohol dehydrogenase family)
VDLYPHHTGIAKVLKSYYSNLRPSEFHVNFLLTSNDCIAMIAAIVSTLTALMGDRAMTGAVFGVPNAVHTYDEEAWLKTIDVNLHGVFRVSKTVVPLMTDGGGCQFNRRSGVCRGRRQPGGGHNHHPAQ